MPRDLNVVLLALSPLNPHGEGMYLVGVTDVKLREFTRTKLWLSDMAHLLLIRDEQAGEMRVMVVPVVGMESGVVDVTNYTAIGYAEEPLLSPYEQWLDAKNQPEPEVEEDVHDTELSSSNVSDGTLEDTG